MLLLLVMSSNRTDPTTLSYWLNWRVGLCALWVVVSMIIGFYLIWKYEKHSDSSGERTEEEEESSRDSSYVAAWKPCLEHIHPIYLLVFRIIAFCLLFVAITFDVALHGFQLYYYYTQWTFTLITIYFAVGSLISLHGCIHYHRNSKYSLAKDTENGLYTPLSTGVNGKGDILLERLEHPGKLHFLLSSSFWGDLFQILFQMTAGAVAITDLVYWCVMYPFLDIKEYQMNFLTVVAHSLNAVMLFGDIALNRMKFPWFRIAYFVFLTSFFVLFQWIVHATESIWWPYPFLELSSNYAPLWYLIVALLHLPSYGLFVMIVKAKHLLLSRWFPNSFCYARETIS